MSSEVVTSRESPTRLGRRTLITALVAVMVFAALGLASDLGSLGQSLQRFHWSALGIALALVLGNYGFRFLRWQYYLRVLQVSVPARLSGLVFLSGFVMSVTPGKMGEVFKSVLLNEYRDVSVARTASIVVAERLLDLVALVLLVSLGSTAFAHGRAVALAGACAVSALALICVAHPVGNLLIDLVARVRLTSGIAPKLRESYDALQDLTRPRPFLVGGSLALLGWALECMATWFLVQGLEIAMDFQGATFAYAAGTLAGALAMLPGGLGVAEVGMSALFRAASPGLSLAGASAATILVRLSTLWFGVALGGLSLLILRATERKHGH